MPGAPPRLAAVLLPPCPLRLSLEVLGGCTSGVTSCIYLRPARRGAGTTQARHPHWRVKYKNIKSVAHNLGHSFLSDMNAVGEGSRYVIVPARLFEIAARARLPVVRIDFLARRVEPPEVRVPEVEQAVSLYANWLPHLCSSQNVSPETVVAATLTLTFDYERVRRTKYHPVVEIQEFVCDVTITDDRGVVHRASPDHWWMV